MKLVERGLTWRELDGTIVVLHLDRSVYLNVTGAGTVIWKCLVHDCSFEDLVDAVLDEFDVDRPTAEGDVAQFVDELRRRALLAE